MLWSSPRQFVRPSRHSVRIPCQIVRERDFVLVADRIDNLSVTGMMASPADLVLTGEKLIVSFQTPGWGLWIDTEATVARVIHGRRPGEFTRALGLEFDKLTDWQRFVLEKNLRWVPPTPPSTARGPSGAIAMERILARLSWRNAQAMN
jgi:hypothetical protein